MPRKQKEEVVDESTVIKAPKVPGPYDIINMIFTNASEFNKLSNTLLEKNFFMINRIFSIKYPLQAAIFNKLTINMAEVIKCWAVFIVSKEGYGKVPYFVYTKGAKKTEEKKDTYNISKELKTEYCKRYKLSLRDYDDLYLLYKDEFINDVLKYEKLTSIKEQEKNFIKQK